MEQGGYPLPWGRLPYPSNPSRGAARPEPSPREQAPVGLLLSPPPQTAITCFLAAQTPGPPSLWSA